MQQSAAQDGQGIAFLDIRHKPLILATLLLCKNPIIQPASGTMRVGVGATACAVILAIGVRVAADYLLAQLPPG